ncbi:zinc finger protein 783-like isoform X3 [Carettochelys insculpta]|uniref:zinc finger protein 783-like isoform X3 n=1 Tax=Carettochelys insculpta TaxID=44489 RepID=UPI003EB78344
MAAGPSARVPVAFEEVAVYFSPAEWAELAEWQQELYWEVMKENYALVASLGSDDIRLGSWIGATRQAKPGIRAGRIVGAAAGPRVPLHQDKAGERQSCVRPAQVAFEDVAVRFSPAEWAELAEWQRELYWAVMRETYELLASLGSADAQPESAWHTERLAQQPWQQRGVYEAPSLAGARSRAGDTQRSPGAPKPLSGAAAAPAPHTCKDCGQSFAERDMLVVHVLRTHLGDRRLPCKECGKSLSGPGRLAAHQRAHLRERTFTCVACKRSVVYKPPLVDSVRLELAGGKPFKCTRCSNRLTLMVDPLAARRRGSFPCPRCQRVFPSACLLQRHQLLHGGEPAFPCAQCGKSPPGRGRMGRQPGPCTECTLPEHRAPEPPFPCAQCGRHFPRPGALAAHLRAHSRPLLHACAQCSQRFGSKRALLAHQQDHAPARPCRECGQSFHSRAARAAHRLEHERQKPFCCAECGKGFRCPGRYALHQGLHAPVACPQCGQHFPLPSQLERHQRLHRASRKAGLRVAMPGAELGPQAGPAAPSLCDPAPGPSPACAMVSPPTT